MILYTIIYAFKLTQQIDQMIVFDQEFKIKQPLCSLNRYNQTLTGIACRNSFQLLQIDLKNRVYDELYPSASVQGSPTKLKVKINNQIKYAKYMRTFFGHGYYFIYDDRIQFQNSNIIMGSNSKAVFMGPPEDSLLNYGNIYGNNDTMLLCKYHKNYQKHSLNIVREEEQKKIISLYDNQLSNVQMLQQKIIFEDEYMNIGLIFGENLNKTHIIRNESFLLYDQNYSYTAFKSESLSGQYMVRGYTSRDLTGYNKNSYSFQLALKQKSKPIKIENFKFDILVATDNKFKAFDIRKLVVPYHEQTKKGLSDFYYDPNLQKIYVSSNNGVHVYRYS